MKPRKQAKSGEEKPEDAALPPHPFRFPSPSSEPPRSLGDSFRQDRTLIGLLKAINAHDMARIKKILSSYQDASFVHYEVLPLVFAAHRGQLETVQLLIDNGANIYLASKLPVYIMEDYVCVNDHAREVTALEAAKAAGHKHVVEFLEKISKP